MKVFRVQDMGHVLNKAWKQFAIKEKIIKLKILR